MRNISVAAAALWLVFGCVIAQQPGRSADRAYKDVVLRKVAELVENKYVLADKAKGFADAFRAKGASGAYDAFLDDKEFAAAVSADLVSITRDKHMNLRVIESSEIGEVAVSPLHHPVRFARLREKENTGFARLEMIEPGVGLLELRRFYSFDQAKDMAQAAMSFLAAANAIIIDVRENGGGSGDYLSSFFLPYPAQLSGLYTRADDTLTETWTRRDIGMKPRTDVPLFILIGPRTFSAAEYFAYDMQSRKRATLVGEPTGGGAHNIDLFRVDDRFELSVSTGRAVSPVTGGNWEGIGVLPDVPAPAASALEQALPLAKEAAERFDKAKQARVKNAVDGMQADLDRAEALFKEQRTAEAEAALDSLFLKARSAGLLTEFFVVAFAYNYRSGESDATLLAILKLGLEYFPRSSDLAEYSAYACYERGEKDLALRYFRKALELNPDSRTSAKMVKELGGPSGPGRR
jgi:tetratricopeptide (TPR) repeat protein